MGYQVKQVLTFADQTFATVADWKRAFPVYASYPEFLRDGATTVMEMEKRIGERHAKARAASNKAARNGAFAARHHAWQRGKG